MKRTLKLALGGAAAAGAVTLVMAGAVFLPGVTQAADSGVTPTALTNLAAPEQRGRPGEADAALAAALGITEEELEAAQQKAGEAAIDLAVEQGLLTEEQATQLKERGADRFGFGGRMGNGALGDVDLDALLADALGITTEKLDAAREQVQADFLAQAVEEGRITEEQAALSQAAQALRDYLAPKLEAFYDEALADAVSDGIVTQEQLDALQAQGWGVRGGARFDDHGFMGGPGGHGRGGRSGAEGRGWMMEPGARSGRGSDTLPDSSTTPEAEPESTPASNG